MNERGRSNTPQDPIENGLRLIGEAEKKGDNKGRLFGVTKIYVLFLALTRGWTRKEIEGTINEGRSIVREVPPRRL